MAAQQVIPFWPEEVGAWWSSKAQIDLVAVQSARRSALLGEARWRREKMNVTDLDDLQVRARHWLGDERGWELWYALYGRSGFSEELQARAVGDSHLLLFTPSDVVGW